jgi:uncharacterized protein (TIGR02996 family)
VNTPLAQFVTELEAGKRRAAYELALAAWRETHAPELAVLVERAARAFATADPLPTKSQKARVEAWLARARTREPYEARWLLEQLRPLVEARKGSIVAACLDELVTVRDDPSLTLAACALLALPGGAVAFGTWGKVLTRMFKLLANSCDARAIPQLEALAATTPSREGNTESALEFVRERSPALFATLRAVPVRALAADELAVVATCTAALDQPLPAAAAEASPTGSADALFEAVLAAPADDQARAVWADALQEVGDPRGELIALQLAGATNEKAAKSAQKLIAKHWRTWVGALAPAIIATSVEFERGLLDACVTDVRRKSVATAIFDHPHWASVRRITFNGWGQLAPGMQRLEEARGVPDSGLAALAKTAFPALRVLAIKGDPGDQPDDGMLDGAPASRGMKAFAATKGLPALRALKLSNMLREWSKRQFRDRQPGDFAWLARTPFASQLESFGLSAAWPDWNRELWAAYLAIVAPMPALREYRIQYEGALVLALRERRVMLDLSEAPVHRHELIRDRARSIVGAEGWSLVTG